MLMHNTRVILADCLNCNQIAWVQADDIDGYYTDFMSKLPRDEFGHEIIKGQNQEHRECLYETPLRLVVRQLPWGVSLSLISLAIGTKGFGSTLMSAVAKTPEDFKKYLDFLIDR